VLNLKRATEMPQRIKRDLNASQPGRAPTQSRAANRPCCKSNARSLSGNAEIPLLQPRHAFSFFVFEEIWTPANRFHSRTVMPGLPFVRAEALSCLWPEQPKSPPG